MGILCNILSVHFCLKLDLMNFSLLFFHNLSYTKQPNVTFQKKKKKNLVFFYSIAKIHIPPISVLTFLISTLPNIVFGHKTYITRTQKYLFLVTIWVKKKKIDGQFSRLISNGLQNQPRIIHQKKKKKPRIRVCLFIRRMGS